MDSILIKKYQQEIREANTLVEKQLIASKLHAYVETLSLQEQQMYKNSVLTTLENKFEVMDKLIAAYEAIKKDDLVLV
jgi:trans-aconitate methyltransferase